MAKLFRTDTPGIQYSKLLHCSIVSLELPLKLHYNFKNLILDISHYTHIKSNHTLQRIQGTKKQALSW